MRIRKVQSVILLQIVMVSPGTRLVNYHESHFQKTKGKNLYYRQYASLKVATRRATEIT